MWNIDLLISSRGWILTGELPAFGFQNIQKDVCSARTVVRCPDGQQGDFRSRIGKITVGDLFGKRADIRFRHDCDAQTRGDHPQGSVGIVDFEIGTR